MAATPVITSREIIPFKLRQKHGHMITNYFKVSRLVAKIVLSIPFKVAIIWTCIKIVEEGNATNLPCPSV